MSPFTSPPSPILFRPYILLVRGLTHSIVSTMKKMLTSHTPVQVKIRVKSLKTRVKSRKGEIPFKGCLNSFPKHSKLFLFKLMPCIRLQ